MNVYTCTHLSLNISVFLLTILVTFIMILFLIKTRGNLCYMCILCEYWGLKLYSLTHVTGTRNENYSFWMKLIKFKYSQTFSCFVNYVCSCAVSNLKKCSLELGGKSPLIIFSDCDMDRAVRQVRMHHHTILVVYWWE